MGEWPAGPDAALDRGFNQETTMFGIPVAFAPLALLLAAALVFFAGVRVVRPTSRGLVERLGRYHRLASPGFNWIIPGVDRMLVVNVTEVMVNAEPQEIITSDKLNARVDAQVYFKVKSDEESVKSSQYSVFDYESQMVNLARTTLRNIIGTLTLKSANSERGKINSELQRTMRQETTHWGIEIVRTELKEIDPPQDVQETMNKVVKAENEKVAAVDFATATETMADGARRAEIKKAEGIKQAKILEAEGEAQAIQLVNEAADKFFVGNAQLLRRLVTLENALSANTKFVLPANGELVNIVGDMAGILPLSRLPVPARSSSAGSGRSDPSPRPAAEKAAPRNGGTP
jgi:regulator of protease activity HflC (stomatin/prohibitin superfamily)